ncbi:MAG: hypothetical protein ACOZNI_19830 [Myxococcota bacterium]
MFARIATRPLPATLALFGLFVLACAKSVEIPESYQPAYSYTPPSSTEGQGIGIAIVAPHLGQAATSNLLAQYQKLGVAPPPDYLTRIDPGYRAFMDAVGRSLLQYFTASGFTVSGPFRSIDDMTFPEKKQADLVLTIDVNVTTDQPKFWVNRSAIDGSVASVESKGACSSGGTIDFVLWEPLSAQRMWAKSVEVPRTEADCTIKSGSGEAYDALIRNAFAQLSEEAFTTTMTTATRYFAPEEVALVAKQSRELREKKVY